MGIVGFLGRTLILGNLTYIALLTCLCLNKKIWPDSFMLIWFNIPASILVLILSLGEIEWLTSNSLWTSFNPSLKDGKQIYYLKPGEQL